MYHRRVVGHRPDVGHVWPLVSPRPAGTVIRYAPMAEHYARAPRQDIIGRNFFAEVMPGEPLNGCRARFIAFMARGQAVEKFSLKVPCGGGVVHMQVVLAAIPERAASERRRLVLVRITPEQA